MVPSLLCTFVAHIIFLHVFFLLPPFHSLSLCLSVSLSRCLSVSLSLCLSVSLSLSPPSFSLWLQDTCHLMPFTKYPLLNQSYFFTPYPSIAHIKIHQLFTDYLLQLPSSELLEKHLFRSRANRRLVLILKIVPGKEQKQSEGKWSNRQKLQWVHTNGRAIWIKVE